MFSHRRSLRPTWNSLRLVPAILAGIGFIIGAFATSEAQAASVRIDTSEGTWMSLEVDPGNRFIVFDHLGSLYRIPVTGGRARSLTDAHRDSATLKIAGLERSQPYNHHPALSPDGRTILFVSDRDGADNLWTMSSDGRALRQLTWEKDRTAARQW